jgi:hypothetical protein
VPGLLHHGPWREAVHYRQNGYRIRRKYEPAASIEFPLVVVREQIKMIYFTCIFKFEEEYIDALDQNHSKRNVNAYCITSHFDV